MSFELSLILNVLVLGIFCLFHTEKKHFKNTRIFVYIAIAAYLVIYVILILKG